MIKINLTDRSELEKWYLEQGEITLTKRLKSKNKKFPGNPILILIQDNLETILIGNPNQLKDLIPKFEVHRGDFDIVEITSIFNYENSFAKKDADFEWCAYNLFKKLKINTCPYCNDNFTHTIIKNKDKTSKGLDKRILRPDLDHFYDKGTHPYLAVSLYNLIPCCTVCNSRLKLSKNFTVGSHVNPYLEGFGNDVKFNVKVNDITFFQGNSEKCNVNFKFSDINNPITKKACNNIKDFKLKEIYSLHKDYIYELIHKSMIYSDDYLDDLYKQYEGTIFKNREDLIRMVAANYIDDEDLHLRPLSKLTKDVIEQLGLW
jgi:hypothetical protein